MKGKARHDFIYNLAWHLCHLPLARKFNFKYESIKVDDSPYIVVSNHLTNWDPLLIGLSFRKCMYYVASDHIMRMGLISKILDFVMSPIVRVKTSQETQTVITIFRRLKEKCNICIFVEGATSFDGVTSEIQPSIGKLIKRAGVTLVTYRFTGSYFTFPRWARFLHKGKMEGKLAQIYKPEKIAGMSEEDIYQAIKKDIYLDAYEEQEKNPVKYKGKKPAEYLETTLYCCPECKQFGTLKSQGDTLFCSCGFKVRYNEYCYFEFLNNAEQPPFKTIKDWVEWERKEINFYAEKNLDNNTLITYDDNQLLYEIVRSSRNVLVAKGKLCMYKDRLSMITDSGEAIDFFLKDIIEMSIITKMTIIFSTEHKVYEIHSIEPRSALKYTDMYKTFKYKL